MKRILLLTLGIFIALNLSVASATPVSFTESFNNTSLPSTLVQSTSGAPAVFDGDVALFPGTSTSGRSYLRTLGSDYNTLSFTAEITVNILNDNGGNGVVFFGLGEGEPNSSFYYEPSTGANLYIRPSPDDFIGGGIYVGDGGVDNHYGGDLSGTGTHRLQMSWDAALQRMTFAIHQDYTGGPFTASSTFGYFDGSDNGFNSLNSHIFFGGTMGTTFDDLSVVVEPVPEPATILLFGSGIAGLVGSRLRRKKKA